MELVAAKIGEERVEVTLGDGNGLIGLTGTPDEIVTLCEAMDEVALLAGASSTAVGARGARGRRRGPARDRERPRAPDRRSGGLEDARAIFTPAPHGADAVRCRCEA